MGRATWDAIGVRSVEDEGDGKRDAGSSASAIGDGVEVNSPSVGFGTGKSRCDGRAFARFETEAGSCFEGETDSNGSENDGESIAGVEAGTDEACDAAESPDPCLGGEFDDREIAASRAEPGH